MENTEIQLPHHVSTSKTSKFSRGPSSPRLKLWSRNYIMAFIVASLLPILIPLFHFGILSKLWEEYNFPVDPHRCSCACWDTVFKGPYDRGPSGYKHVYFNITSNTFKIWSTTVMAVILLYESSKYILTLLFDRQVRVSMLVLLLLSIYPHYYAWWSCFNYWNDDFYEQWNHQMFFSLTEMLSTVTVVHLLDRRVSVTSSKCLIILSVALLHILVSGFDQFIENVVRGNGFLHQVLRDVFFMVPDAFHVLVPLLQLRKLAQQQHLPSAAHVVTTPEFCASVAFVCTMWIVARLL
ncbi:hypothetical protein FHG87_002043 [Trinorchestia longiramus]|nr:hypothetical protein FHG87_002043 [Trinorchestia longiramus]